MSKEIFKKVVSNDPKALAEIKLAILNGLDIKYEMNEATNYEIKDNKVLITRDNYNKKHKDYKLGKKGEEKLLVLDPKNGGTVLMPVKFIDEAIDEAKAIKVDGKELDWNKLRSNYKNKHFKYNGTIEDLKDGVTIMFDKNFIIYPDIKNDKYYVMNLASETLIDMVQGSRAEKDLKVYIDKYNINEVKDWVLDKENSEKDVDVYAYKQSKDIIHFINVYKDGTNSLDYIKSVYTKDDVKSYDSLSGTIDKINNHLKKLKLPIFNLAK